MPQTVSRSTINAAIERGELKRAIVAPSGTGDVEVIAAVPGKRIVLVNLRTVASAATVITLKSGSTALTGAMSRGANSVLALTDMLLATEPGEAFVVNQTVDGVDGWVHYVLL